MEGNGLTPLRFSLPRMFFAQSSLHGSFKKKKEKQNLKKEEYVISVPFQCLMGTLSNRLKIAFIT